MCPPCCGLTWEGWTSSGEWRQAHPSRAMIPAAYLYHPLCKRHAMGEGHPEQPDRLRVIHQALSVHGLLDRLLQMEPLPAAMDALLRVHDNAYLRSLEQAQPEEGAYRVLGPDAVMNNATWSAALLAAGAGLMAVDNVLGGTVKRAFCNVRPPGHHAVRARAMGFCFLNNIAVAATHALERHGLRKLAIIDFDVHHGNGTEAILADDPRVLLCSTFQSPLYPYSGESTVSEHIVNVPLPAGTGSADYRFAFSARVIPALERFQPELILFSAGFDAHRDDPLAALELTEEDYYWLTRKVIETTRLSSGGRVVSLLEGGYALGALAASACRHVEALLED